MRYAISATISEREHVSDRWEYIAALFAGDREWLDDNGWPLSQDAILTRPVRDLFAWADDEMGEEYDSLWLYLDGSEGLDPDSRLLFDTREAAESAAGMCRMTGTSIYEVVEVP